MSDRARFPCSRDPLVLPSPLATEDDRGGGVADPSLQKQPFQQIIHQHVGFSKHWKKWTHCFQGLDERGVGDFIGAVFVEPQQTVLGGFEMKLKGEHVAPIKEGLILGRLARSEAHCTVRNIKGVAVPMKHLLIFPSIGKFSSKSSTD